MGQVERKKKCGRPRHDYINIYIKSKLNPIKYPN